MVDKLSDIENDLQAISGIQRDIDIITAVLLLTGQLTIIRIFIESGGFGFTVGGPMTGRFRLEGKSGSETGNFIIDAIDIVVAILLVNDEIGVNGLFISPGGFSFNVSGPIFGVSRIDPTLPSMKKMFNEFRLIVSEQFHVDHELVRKFKKE
jgi:hypothetical protein